MKLTKQERYLADVLRNPFGFYKIKNDSQLEKVINYVLDGNEIPKILNDFLINFAEAFVDTQYEKYRTSLKEDMIGVCLLSMLRSIENSKFSGATLASRAGHRFFAGVCQGACFRFIQKEEKHEKIKEKVEIRNSFVAERLVQSYDHLAGTV